MRLEELDYDLPPDLIATVPTEPRDACRLLVVSRTDSRLMEHRHFHDLPQYLTSRDLLVFNRSAVLPARLIGVRIETGGRAEGLYVGAPGPGVWSVLLKTKGRLLPGERIGLHDADGSASPYEMELIDRNEEGWLTRVRDLRDAARVPSVAEVLERVGATPLPPYILKARRERHMQVMDDQDRRWYQTVYAATRNAGSVAAPTAGLHFTPELLSRLDEGGVGRAEVVLHVGIGTFKPIQTDVVEDHPMHEEAAEASASALAAIGECRARAGRVIAVGTTSVRAMESVPHPLNAAMLASGFAGPTRLFIRPPYEFKMTDGLVTNFHLPRSTLLAMVGALFDGGVPRLLEVYREAVGREYRFFSYGDAMLVLP